MENELAAERANELATRPDFGEKQLARHLINVTPASTLNFSREAIKVDRAMC